MATYSPTTTAGVTDTYEYTIGFPYARLDDVKVYIDDVEISRGSGAGKFQFSSSGTKVIFEDGSEPQTGETLTIKRVTDISNASVTYSAGSGFVHPDINLALNQLLYAIDELQVPAFDSGWVTAAALAAAEYSTPHNLGAVPSRWRVSLWCTSTDAGYPIHAIIEQAGMSIAPIIYWTSTTLVMPEDIVDTWTVPHNDTGVQTTIDTAKWSIRVQAWR